MTPAQSAALAVALDHLREAFGDDANAAIVREVLRAMEPNHDSRIAAAQREADAKRIEWALPRSNHPDTMTGCAIIVRSNALVSPPETATGAHAHRPEAPAAEPVRPKAEACNCVPSHPRDCPPEGIHKRTCPIGVWQQARYG